MSDSDNQSLDHSTAYAEAENKILLAEKSGSRMDIAGTYTSEIIKEKELKVEQEKKDMLTLAQKLDQIRRNIEQSFKVLDDHLHTMSDIADRVSDLTDHAHKQIGDLKHVRSAINSKNPNEQETVLIHILGYSKEEYKAMSKTAKQANLLQGYNEKVDAFEQTKQFLNKQVSVFKIEEEKFEDKRQEIESDIIRLKEAGKIDEVATYQKQLDNVQNAFDRYKNDISDQMQELRDINATEFEKASNAFVSGDNNYDGFEHLIHNTTNIDTYNSITSAFNKASNAEQETPNYQKPSVIGKLEIDNGGFNF